MEAEEAIAETARFWRLRRRPSLGRTRMFTRRGEALRAVHEKLRAIDAALASTLADLLCQRLAQPQLQEVATLAEQLRDTRGHALSETLAAEASECETVAAVQGCAGFAAFQAHVSSRVGCSRRRRRSRCCGSWRARSVVSRRRWRSAALARVRSQAEQAVAASDAATGGAAVLASRITCR